MAAAGAPAGYAPNVESEALALLAGVPPEPTDAEGEEQEGEDAEEMQRKMNEALLLNQQLKAMWLEAQEQQQMQQQREMPQRGRQQQQLTNRPAPRVGAAKNGGWGGTTHTDGRATEINRANAILVSKLSNIATRNRQSVVPVGSGPPRRVPQGKSSVSINQRKKDDQIARENAAMARRLNSVKPTTTLSAKTASKHAAQHNKYVQMLRPATQVAGPRSPLRGQSAGHGRGPTTPQLVPRGAFE